MDNNYIELFSVDSKEGVGVKGKDVIMLDAPEVKLSPDTPLLTNAQDIAGAINELFQLDPGGGDPDPEPEWQPPTDWIPVPEPGPYEMYFLVAKEGSFTFECQLYRPDLGSTLENCEEATVYWGDDNVEVYKNFFKLEHSYTNGGMYLIKIITDGKPCHFYSCNAPVLIAKLGDEIITKCENGNSCPFDGCSSYVKQIKIGGKDGIHENEFFNFKYLAKFDSTTQLKVIPAYAFRGCFSLKNIDLSNVTSIGEGAFYQCQNLSMVNATNLEHIGNYAFYECSKLTTINASNVIIIGNYAFQECKILKSVDLPKLTEINRGTFYTCYALSTINVPEVTKIGDYAFCECSSLNSVDMPNVTTVGKTAFGSTAVSKVNMPACTSVGDDCFSYCYNLDSPKDFVVANNCTFGKTCFFSVVIYPPIA